MPAQTRNQHASRATRFSSFQLRNDALMIGPSGELVEAHAAGNAAPAIPEPVVGRIPADPGDTAHALPNQPKQPVIVTFTGTSAASESTAVPAVSVQAISVTISSSAAPPPSLAAFSTSMVASSASMPSSVTSVPVSVAPTSMAMLSSVISASASQTTNVPASSSVVYPVETSSSSTGSVHHGSSLSVAIVFAVLAGFALVVSLVVWFTKIRAKSRRQELVERTAWPWDHNDRQIEDGYYTGSYYGQDEKSAPSIHSVLPLPPGLVGRDEIMHDSHHVPMPQSPYRLVSNELHQSVYDLAPEMGSLRVANYVPGDSRATSRLGMIAGQQSGSTEGPNTSLDDFGMLKHPWPSARNNSDNSIIPEEKKDPYYFSNDDYARQSGGMPDAKAPSDTWVSSLRSNIFNAFQVVVGGNSSTASQDDCYTAEPVKVNPASRQGAQAMSRQSSAQSQTAQSCYTSSAGRVIDLNNQSTWLSGAAYQRHASDPELNLPIPPLAIVKDRDRGTLSRASSVYSTASASRVEPPSTGFGLPHIPMSRSGSQSSLQQAFRGRDLDHAAAESSREQTGEQAGSIRNRAQSVMSSISKTASSHSEAWTDQEQFASSVLKERRKRSSDVHEATSEDNIQ